MDYFPQNINARFFTRKGGVSEGIYASLNCGYGSGDDITKVQKNRAIVAETLCSTAREIYTLKQVHSNTPIFLDNEWDWQNAPEGDAIITTRKNIVIGALTADCVPTLIASRCGSIIAAIHSGWKGALNGILQRTIDKIEHIGFSPEDLTAVIGPAINQESYEVGNDLRDHFILKSPNNAAYFIDQDNKYLFDLKGYVANILRGSGVHNVHDMQIDTFANEAEYFSYRRTTKHGDTQYGRQISAIAIL